MKSSQRESSLSYEKNESYIRELNHLQEWFGHLLAMFEQAKKPSRERIILKLNIAFVIEVLMYNLFYLTRQTHHKLIEFLSRPNFTNSFPKIGFPSLVNVIDLHAQTQSLNVSQTNTWEKFSENLRIGTVKTYGASLVNRCKQESITNHFNETVGSINVSLIERLNTQLNFRTHDTLAKYIRGERANSQPYTLSAMEKEKFKDACVIAEAEDPKEFKKVFQFKTSEIRLPSGEKSWLAPLKGWWYRDSIMMSDLTIRVTMLCGLAEDQSILSGRRQAMLQKFLLQTKEEIEAKISAQKNKWFSKLGLNNNALDSQLKNLITRITEIEKLHLNFQPQQPAKEGGQGDSHGTMTGCSVDSDSDSDLDLDDEPSAQPLTENTVTTSHPRLIPTMLHVEQLLLDLLPKEDDKTVAVQPQKQQAIDNDNTELKKNQTAAVNTPLKKSAQPQPTKSDGISKNSKDSKANQNHHVIQTQLAARQVKRPVFNKSLVPVPVPNQPQPLRKKSHNHLQSRVNPKPRVNPNTKPKSPQVKPVAVPANARVSNRPSRSELTALKAMNICALRQKEKQRKNNLQPTVLQAEAGSLLGHP